MNIRKYRLYQRTATFSYHFFRNNKEPSCGISTVYFTKNGADIKRELAYLKRLYINEY